MVDETSWQLHSDSSMIGLKLFFRVLGRLFDIHYCFVVALTVSDRDELLGS